VAKRTSPGPENRRGCRIGLLLVALAALVTCTLLIAVFSWNPRHSSDSRVADVTVACSPDKLALFEELIGAFQKSDPRLATGKRIQVAVVGADPDEMMRGAAENVYQAVTPDSSIWLADMNRYWRDSVGGDGDLVGDTIRYMVSPVVIAMWQDTAESMGYPDAELGWRDILDRADTDPGFGWSHPSTSSASGLLATLAEFHVGAGVTRGLTEDQATDQATLDYVARLERTVKYYGEGESTVFDRIKAEGRGALDAFVAQEQLVVEHNRTGRDQVVAIYPIEGSMWLDHPLALIELPERTTEERQAFTLLRDYLLSPDAQSAVLAAGYRPADLSIPLNREGSPLSAENGVDPAQPYTTIQMPSTAVIQVIRNAWLYTKRHTNVFLVADVSGSMKGRKLQDAQVALQAFLDQIEGGEERVGLIVFGSSAREVVGLAQLEAARAPLEDAIAGLEAGSNTALLDGVDLALTKLTDLNDADRINAIVVMTDGKENRSRASLGVVVNKLLATSQSNTPVVVFCVAYGRDADLSTLGRLSDASGGITKRGDVESIEDLYRTLSTYF